MRRSMGMLSMIVGVVALICSGCATLPSGEAWGASATIRPGWVRVREAARDAATDPWVWVPLAGAAAFQVNNFDRKVSDWARAETPVFGSEQSAEDWSDNLRSITVLAQFATLLATPSGKDPGEWIVNKAKGEAVELMAVGSTALMTGVLKSAANRERPNGANDESFPSGHASAAAVHGRLAEINLQSIDMSPGARSAAVIGLDALVIGTGWARVEAGAHFPSDSLVGMAIGNFFASFITQAFLSDEARGSIAVAVADGGVAVQWRVGF